jgi:class 3 adenylate cyclase
VQIPDTKYTRSADGLRLAYQQWGEGPPLLIVPALLSNVEVAWEHELYRRVLEYIGRHMTCVQFDKRGIGLSDRPDELPTLEQRIGDIVDVMDAVGWDRAHLLGMSEGGIMSQLFAAEYPERVDHLLLIGTGVPPRYWDRIGGFVRPGDAYVMPVDELYGNFGRLAEGWPENADFFVGWFMPSAADNESYVRWVGRLQRLSASPKDFAHQVESVLTLDAGDAPERITAPTLVMHVTGDRVLPVAGGRLLAELIPGARYCEISGDNHFQWIQPNWREVIDTSVEFFTGSIPAPTTTRRFATVLFTDIVGSTQRSAMLGDRAWRAVLDQHDRTARKIVDEHAGRVVKSTGDGLLAVFDVPSQGVDCGLDLCRALAAIDVPIRAGVHAGEIEVHDDGDISGIAVNLAARVEQSAADGELWVSSTVRDMMLGGAAGFDERGEHSLKGIDGSWKLFAVR